MGKVKKQSGYLDNKGKFHRTLHACNNENLWIEINKLRSKTQNLLEYYTKIYEEWLKRDAKAGYENSFTTVSHIVKAILNNEARDLVQYVNKRDEIEERIDKLRDLAEKPRVLRKDWWFGTKIKVEELYEK